MFVILVAVTFLVRVVSEGVVVELGVVNQSFPFDPARRHPRTIVLVQVLAEVACTRTKSHRSERDLRSYEIKAFRCIFSFEIFGLKS